MYSMYKKFISNELCLVQKDQQGRKTLKTGFNCLLIKTQYTAFSLMSAHTLVRAQLGTLTLYSIGYF